MAAQAVTARALPLRSYRDPFASVRAQAAFEEVWNRIGAAIDAAAADVSLSRHDRTSAIRALRERQKVEASIARRRVIEEEAAAAKQRRQQARDLTKPNPK